MAKQPQKNPKYFLIEYVKRAKKIWVNFAKSENPFSIDCCTSFILLRKKNGKLLTLTEIH